MRDSGPLGPSPWSERPWPPILGLYKSVAVALAYLRRNRVQAELAETFGVSQPTVSRAIAAITPLLGDSLADYVPTADDLDTETQYIVDGSLLPCWSWASHPELYSGKHKTTGMNVQLACTLSGELSWISDAINGSRHDSHCLDESGALEGFQAGRWIGDTRFISGVLLNPPPMDTNSEFLDWVPAITRDSKKRDGSPPPNVYRVLTGERVIDVRMSSIHGVKGETHFATLVLETFYYGHALKSLLPWLAGQRQGSHVSGKARPVSSRDLRRLRMNYVALTRSTHVVCLALPAKNLGTAPERALLRSQLEAQGWQIMEIPARIPRPNS